MLSVLGACSDLEWLLLEGIRLWNEIQLVQPQTPTIRLPRLRELFFGRLRPVTCSPYPRAWPYLAAINIASGIPNLVISISTCFSTVTSRVSPRPFERSLASAERLSITLSWSSMFAYRQVQPRSQLHRSTTGDSKLDSDFS